MKRICCFCESWESGGIESFLASVYTHADLSELEIDIVTSKLLDSVFTARLEKLGIRFYQLSGSQRRLLTNHAMFRRLLRERHYDVLHINAFQSLSLYYAKLAMQAGVPVRIAHSHNTALRKSPLRWAKMLLHRMGRQYLGRYATALWACSRDAANFLFSQRDLAARGYTFIPNGIALSRFRFDPKQREAARAELGCSDGVLIGNVGRLCYQKNQEFLLDILPAILTREPRARLLLVGEGADEEKLRSRAAALNIADRVIFYGVTGGVERLLWAMDVFAFPSRFEDWALWPSRPRPRACRWYARSIFPSRPCCRRRRGGCRCRTPPDGRRPCSPPPRPRQPGTAAPRCANGSPSMPWPP